MAGRATGARIRITHAVQSRRQIWPRVRWLTCDAREPLESIAKEVDDFLDMEQPIVNQSSAAYSPRTIRAVGKPFQLV
jgi:hypothetical protein